MVSFVQANSGRKREMGLTWLGNLLTCWGNWFDMADIRFDMVGKHLDMAGKWFDMGDISFDMAGEWCDMGDISFDMAGE